MFKIKHEGELIEFDLARISDGDPVTSIRRIGVKVPKYAMKRKGFLKGAYIHEVVSKKSTTYHACLDETFQMDQFGRRVSCGEIVCETFHSLDTALRWIAKESRMDTLIAKTDLESTTGNVAGLSASLPGEIDVTFVNSKVVG